MDTLTYIITFFISFFMDNRLQRSLSVTAETLRITGDQCVEYLGLQSRTSLTYLRVTGTSMQYFPEGNCNSTTSDEEYRVLDLPHINYLFLLQNALLKMPNVTGMTNLLILTVNNALFSSIPGKPFISNN